MNPIEFRNVGFAYETVPVISDLTVSIPSGITALAGPNGTGKSTFLLLASGRLQPQAGSILLEGRNTGDLDEAEKNRLCSVVFQNLEFETPEPLGTLLETVLANGFLGVKDRGFLDTVTTAFELGGLLTRPTHVLSKGQMQRAVMAFSLLYGSKVLAMDEPVFAMEDGQKRRAMAFVCDYCRSSGISLVYCAHELELNRSFSDRVLLFSKAAPPRLGSAAEVLSRQSLEEAYQIPFSLLHQKEELHRSFLKGRLGGS